jgi:hypothetical protein
MINRIKDPVLHCHMVPGPYRDDRARGDWI